MDGLKWISSFPENVAAGIPRASAVLILNDHDTGYPFACLESSIISATRTAASAALAADWLSRGPAAARPASGSSGSGLIARYIHTFLAGTGWSFDEIGVHDLSADSAAGFRGYLEQSGTAGRVTVHDSAEELIRSSDLVVFATVAGRAARPASVSWFAHNPVVLHVSLRDLAPEILLASTNIVDDVEHCLKANTSPHLVEQLTGNRDFLAGTLDDVMAGRVDGADGSAGGVLPVRPRSARPRGRQVRLRRGRAAPATCTSSTTSSTSCAGTAERLSPLTRVTSHRHTGVRPSPTVPSTTRSSMSTVVSPAPARAGLTLTRSHPSGTGMHRGRPGRG